MELNTLRIIMTILSFAVFGGIVWWAVNPANRARFAEASRIPLDDDMELSPGKGASHG